jgi:hypothetical protein
LPTDEIAFELTVRLVGAQIDLCPPERVMVVARPPGAERELGHSHTTTG